MALVVDIVSWVCLMLGAFFCVAGGIGMLRFPDVYTRGHASGVIDTGGAGFILIGLMLQAGFTLITVKLILILLLLFFTSPTATHALMKGAIGGGLKPVGKDKTKPVAGAAAESADAGR